MLVGLDIKSIHELRKDGAGVLIPGVLMGRAWSFCNSLQRGLRPFPSLSRAIIVRNGEVIPMSREFTPETERQRLQLLVSRSQIPYSCPLLGLVPFCTLYP